MDCRNKTTATISIGALILAFFFGRAWQLANDKTAVENARNQLNEVKWYSEGLVDGLEISEKAEEE